MLAIFTAAIFVSALLLFAVQPMFTRMVLPRLGGSPSVWSVAMVFFQTMLLAGYAFAHVLMRTVRPPVAVAIHIALLVAAGLTLPLSIAQGFGDPPGTWAALWLIGLFAVSIGLPFFALAANNPLLQAWFVRTGHPAGKDPYFLYAASNVGSFLALLSYPFILEPALSLRQHIRLWSGGYWLLFALIAVCGVLLLRSSAGAGVAARDDAPATPAPTWRTLGRWAFLAAIPSGLLVAVTAYISTDIASAPLLWVIPLSLYLLTFVLVFQSRPLVPHRWVLIAQPFAIAGIVALLPFSDTDYLFLNLGAHLLAFFIIAMASHGELARQRPAPDHLTIFYLAISAGGMVGGLFAGLIAPLVFSWVAEYPILLVLATFCRPIGRLGFGMVGSVVLGRRGGDRSGRAGAGHRVPLDAAGKGHHRRSDRHRRRRARIGPADAPSVPGRRRPRARGRDVSALSRRRGAHPDRAELFRRAQNLRHAQRRVPRADERHHRPRRAADRRR